MREKSRVELNLGLARKAARDQWRISGGTDRDFNDYLSEAYVGLVLADRTYRPELGKFSIYAYLKCTWAILDFINDLNGYFKTKYNAEMCQFTPAHDKGKIDKYDDDITINDAIKKIDKSLDNIDHEIISMTLMGLNYSEIGRAVGITREAIRLRADKIFKMLRDELKSAYMQNNVLTI